MQTTTEAQDQAAIAALRHELATMPLEKLRKAQVQAVMRFAMAGSLEAARKAAATADAYTEALMRRIGKES